MSVIKVISGSANNFSDQALILGEREALQINFNNSDYSQVRVGMFFGIVDSASLLPLNGVNYIDTETIDEDYFWFGLKASGSEFPTSSSFLGIRMDADVRDEGIQGRKWGADVAHLISPTFVSSSTYGTFYIFPAGFYNVDVTANVGPGVFWSYQVIVSNKNQSNQTVTISTNNDSREIIAPTGISGSYENSQIINKTAAELFNVHYTGNWHSASVALPLPTSAFFYCPFRDARMAIHSVAVLISE